MKLTLSHSDISLALCEFLSNRGMTAFDPAKVSADFSFKRGSKELVCELDSEPKAPTDAPVVEKPKAVAPVAETPAPEVAPEAPAPEVQVETPAPEAPAAGGDDNLFD